jgi:glycine betaine/proline transport system substrate-binding protein
MVRQRLNSLSKLKRNALKTFSPVLILLLAVSTITCTDIPTRERVVIGEVTWDGGLAIAHVLKIVLETKLGVEVELILADQPVILSAMDKGDGGIDVHPDFWMPNQAGWWNQYIAPGSRETVLVNRNPYHGMQGLFIPQYVQDQYGLNSVTDLSNPEIAKLFDSDSNGKGEYWAGAPGWASTNVEKVKARSYGYDQFFESIEVPMAVFQAKLKTAYSRKKPVLFFSWTPEWIHTSYDLVRLEEPPFDGFAMKSKKDDPLFNPNGCWKMYQPKDDLDWYEKSRITCAWPDADVYIAYSKSLTSRSPQVAQFFNQVTFSSDLVGEWITQMVMEKRDPVEVATKWVANHPEIVNEWIKGIEGLANQGSALH